MASRYPFRICQNNQAAAQGAVLTASSNVSGFPVANVIDIKRSKKLIFAGNFDITTANQLLYINDGTNRTVTLTVGSYASGALMAAQVQTQLNAVSSSWTCSYSMTTFKFTIGRTSGTSTIRLSQTTTSAWSTLGYFGSVDVSAGTGLAADGQRNHTSEKITVDLGVAKLINAFHLMGAARYFGIGSTATMTLKANNVNSFTSPPLTITLTGLIYDEGVTRYFDAEGDQTYRYWQLEFIDKTNPLGPQIPLNIFYLGTYISPPTRNIEVGFEKTLVDPGVIQTADNGTEYYRIKTKFWKYSSLSVLYLLGTDRDALESFIVQTGQCYAFIVSLDPGVVISTTPVSLTKYMRFDGDPGMTQVINNYFNFSFSMKEVI